MKVGILGGGQLAQMLAHAGIPLGIECTVIDPNELAPASAVATHWRAAYDDETVLEKLAREVDVATYEFENVPDVAARILAEKVVLRPSSLALTTAQDRLTEKNTFANLGIPTTLFQGVDSPGDLIDAARVVGFPAVLKTRRLGYDGKGQRVLKTEQDLEGAFEALGSVPCILEDFVEFTRELSLICVRGRQGETRFYPLVETEHREGILRMTTAPAPNLTPTLMNEAFAYGEKLLEHLDYVGVLALELFDTPGGLVANEMAPRVHNSGHWTIEGAHTSQFENHMRAITGLPLGDTHTPATAVMLNLLGEVPNPAKLLAIPGAHLHLYGKAAAPRRKLGHVTLIAHTEDFATNLAALKSAVAP